MIRETWQSAEQCRPFFIVGADRSGTTLLRLMLNRHPMLVIPPESHFLVDLIRKLPRDGPLSREQVHRATEFITGNPRFSGWKTGAEALAEELAACRDPTLAQLIDHVFRLETGATEKVRWGDKTPLYTTWVSEIGRVFPQARFIHIVRDGRDVSLSLENVRWQGWTEYERARYWSTVVSHAERAGGRLVAGRFLRVHYEALVLRPEATLEQVCAFLGCAMHQEMVTFFETALSNIPDAEVEAGIHSKLVRPPRPTDVGRWKTESSSVRVLLFEAVAGRTLQRMTYARRFRGPRRCLVLLTASLYIPIGVSVGLVHRLFDGLGEQWQSAIRSNRLLRRLKRVVVRC